MARIRTIKPELPQSESIGAVSRDARLLFILLWTICDDSGRTRGNSRMLASLLFPYDDDAPGLIDGWLSELEAEMMIERYVIGGSTYLQVSKWLSHQKIDKPSPSKFPAPLDDSRILASTRESSSLDQGPRTKDQGPRTEDQGPRTEDQGEAPKHASTPGQALPRGSRLPEDWKLPKAWGEAMVAEGWAPDVVRDQARMFFNHWTSKTGKDATKLDWRKTFENWMLKVPKQVGRPSRQQQAEQQAMDSEREWLAQHGVTR